MLNFGNAMQMMNLFSQFSKNPAGALMQMGYNIPQNIQNNPQGIVNYLRNSGQMDGQMFNQCNQAAGQFQNMVPKNF